MKGYLSLAFENRGEGTVLTRSNWTLPLQASKPMDLDGAGHLTVMLLNPTGGLLGGDHLCTEIDMGRDTHVVLTTPSATKVYRTDGPPAFQETAMRLQQGAVLEYVPEHLIPYPGSSLRQSLDVQMEAGCSVIIVNSLAVGRVTRGEAWCFKELTDWMTVSHRGQPIFKDRLAMKPGAWAADGLGGTEECGYLGTVVVCSSVFAEWVELTHALTSWLDAAPDVNGGASPLQQGGCSARFLSKTAYGLNAASQAMWDIARRFVLGLPPSALRKT